MVNKLTESYKSLHRFTDLQQAIVYITNMRYQDDIYMCKFMLKIVFFLAEILLVNNNTIVLENNKQDNFLIFEC